MQHSCFQDSLQYVPGRKMTIVTNNRSKIYLREKRNQEREPKSHKAIKKFIKEQNGILKGIVRACRKIPEPLEDRDEQEVEEENQQEIQQETQQEQQEEDIESISGDSESEEQQDIESLSDLDIEDIE